jgi:GT2 family glycosyltransferase
VDDVTDPGFFMMAKTRTWWRGAFSSECVFDAGYPLLHNELELQKRWLKAGMRIGFCPRTYVFHYRSVSRPEGLTGRLGRGAYRPRKDVRQQSPGRDVADIGAGT